MGDVEMVSKVYSFHNGLTQTQFCVNKLNKNMTHIIHSEVEKTHLADMNNYFSLQIQKI